MGNEHEKKFAWEIELEAHRARKRLDRFLVVGAISGCLALAISLYILMAIR